MKEVSVTNNLHYIIKRITEYKNIDYKLSPRQYTHKNTAIVYSETSRNNKKRPCELNFIDQGHQLGKLYEYEQWPRKHK